MRTVLSVVFVFVALAFSFGVAAIAVPFPETHAGRPPTSTISAPGVRGSNFLCFPALGKGRGKGKHKIAECIGDCLQIVCGNPPACTRCACQVIPGCTP